MASESKLQREIREWLRDEQKCIVIKLHAPRGATIGWPDLLVLPPRYTACFIEVKAKGQVLSEIQMQRAIELDNQGYEVLIAYSLQDVKTWWADQ